VHCMAQPSPLAFHDLQIYSGLLRALPQLLFIIWSGQKILDIFLRHVLTFRHQDLKTPAQCHCAEFFRAGF